jgi:O-antigen/teichoic acid export membrane protein
VKREFVRHGLVYGGANLVGSLGTVVLVPIYTHTLAPAEYGIVEYLTVVQNLVQVCAGLEITQAVARFYAGASTESDRRAYASTALWFMLATFFAACAGLYMAFILGGAQAVGLGESRALVVWGLLAVYTRILFYALQSQARWELRSDLYAAANAVAAATTIGLVAYLLFVRGAGVVGAFAGLSAGYGVASVFCLLSLRRTYLPRFEGAKLREMLRFSLPLAVSSVALFCANYGDRVILQSALGFESLGVYGIGARFAAVVTLAINGFQLGAAPLIFRNHAAPGTPAALAQLLRLFLCTGLLAVIVLAACSVELIQLFTTPAYAPAAQLVPVLAFAIVVAGLYIFVPGLALQNMTARLAGVNIANAVLALALVAAFVRIGRETGAAVAVLASATIGFAVHAAFSQRVYRIPIEWRRLIAAYLVTAAAIAALSTLAAAGGRSIVLRAMTGVISSCALIALLSTPEERQAAGRVAAAAAGWRWRRA